MSKPKAKVTNAASVNRSKPASREPAKRADRPSMSTTSAQKSGERPRAGSPVQPKAARGPKFAKGAKGHHAANGVRSAATAKGTSPVGRATGNPSSRIRGASPKRLSCLDAAAKVLGESRRPMKTTEMIEVMETKSLWKSSRGKTPAATLYAAIIREIASMKKQSRFRKVERATFAANN